MLVKIDTKHTDGVVAALAREIARWPVHPFRSLTWDRGMELAAHAVLTKATGAPVYFADPGCPWQRGTSENTNRLLRQYFPKGADLSIHTQTDLDVVADRLNARPRRTLAYSTPAARLRAAVAPTG